MRDAAREAIAMVAGRERADLDKDTILERALRYQVLIVGEAASKVSEDVRGCESEIPWQDIIGMRHVIVHGYDVVDLDEVWETVTRDVPGLLVHIEALIAQIEDEHRQK